MRSVPVKTEDQQAALMLHKARELLMRQQTMLVNAFRAHMAELGMTAPQGQGKVEYTDQGSQFAASQPEPEHGESAAGISR